MPSPVRSPRKIYKITSIKVNLNDVPGIDNLPGSTTEAKTTRDIYVKMKKSHGDYLGLTPLTYNDAVFTGTFKGGGLNNGSTFRRRVGGFRHASYTLIAKTFFAVTETVVNLSTGAVTNPVKRVKTLTIGFPKGHSVSELVTFLSTSSNFNQIEAVRGPSGARTDLGSSAP
jgi:hypothetical protein